MKVKSRPLHDERRSRQRIIRGVFLDRLNTDHSAASVKRVTRVLELMLEVESLRAAVCAAQGARPTANAGPKERRPSARSREFRKQEIVQKQIAEYRERLVELNSLLLRYRWHHIVLEGSDDDLGLMKVTVSDARGSEDLWEADAVSILLREIPADSRLPVFPQGLSRYRRCDKCERWFFAITDHQRFCQASCRKANASQGDEFKEKRRLYMKAYRSQEKKRGRM